MAAFTFTQLNWSTGSEAVQVPAQVVSARSAHDIVQPNFDWRGQVFYQQLAERVSGLPEGMDTTTQDRILVQVNSVSLGYLDTIDVPLLRGAGRRGSIRCSR